MAYKISDDCISCGACAAECPVSAISEGDGKFEIDANTCIECGSCSYTCPANRPLLDYIRAGKSKVGNIIRKRTTKK